MAIYLKNATYIDWNTLQFVNTSIKVNKGINGGLEFISQIPADSTDEVIDCKGKFVTKSFACGHHHVYSALSRGMGAPKKSPANFYEVLKYIWWTLDKCLDKDSIEASALTTAIASAKNGVTYVIDHHASPFAIDGSLEIIAKAFDKVGVGHLLCYEISDRDGIDIAWKGLEETENYLQKRPGLVGLHASFTVSDDTLEKAVSLSDKYDSGLHIHVAEDKYDQEYCMKNYNQRVVERLNDAGVLRFSKTILGHCLHLEANEKELVRESEAWVVQNSESNLNNNVGYFNSRGLNSTNIMLGTDGMHSDMIRSAKSAFYVGQGFDSIDYPGFYNRFRNVHKYLSKNNFAGDGDNNLVVLDYDTPTEINQNNFLGHFLFGIESKHVQHVISQGNLIVKDKKVTTVNEAEILEFSKEQGKKLWERMKK
ncbi:MAG: amidohydrolase family protein [Bacteroidetes bacterium]|nr:amidohydrolase family protein [Bacteroidota bacterium]